MQKRPVLILQRSWKKMRKKNPDCSTHQRNSLSQSTSHFYSVEHKKKKELNGL